jgi:hypothetical protein
VLAVLAARLPVLTMPTPPKLPRGKRKTKQPSTIRPHIRAILERTKDAIAKRDAFIASLARSRDSR